MLTTIRHLTALALLTCLWTTPAFAVLRHHVFSEAIAESQAIGWTQSTRGGRSWSEADLEKFGQWLNEISNKKGGENILSRWGIPHDCFDAILGLHFIYAYTNGLALDYGSGLNSINYATRPADLVEAAIPSIGTANAAVATYEADIWQAKNFSAGLIYVSPGSPGHSYYLSDFNANGLAKKIEGAFPQTFSALNIEWMLERERNGPGNQAPATYRRFPLFINRGNKIARRVPGLYPAALPGGNNAWFACVGSNGGNQRPLWENIVNFLHAATGTRNCAHNSRAAQQAQNGQGPGYDQAAQLMAERLCHLIDERITRVNAGFNHCYGPLDPDLSRCASDAAGDFSTPRFDSRIGEVEQAVRELVQRYSLGAATSGQLSALQCGPYDFHRKLAGHSTKFLTVPAFADNQPGYLAPYLKTIAQAGAVSTDPKVSLPERWGCRDYDTLETCTQGYQDTNAQAALSAEDGITIEIAIGDQNGVAQVFVRTKVDPRLAEQVHFIRINDAGQEQLHNIHGKNNVEFALPLGAQSSTRDILVEVSDRFGSNLVSRQFYL